MMRERAGCRGKGRRKSRCPEVRMSSVCLRNVQETCLIRRVKLARPASGHHRGHNRHQVLLGPVLGCSKQEICCDLIHVVKRSLCSLGGARPEGFGVEAAVPQEAHTMTQERDAGTVGGSSGTIRGLGHCAWAMLRKQHEVRCGVDS